MTEVGSAAVEFAMVLPLVLAAMLALLQVALLGRDALLVSQAARDAAREAAVNVEDEQVRDAALRAGLDPRRMSLEVDRAVGAGTSVTVRVRYRPSLALPFLGNLFPDAVEIRAAVVMRQEAPWGINAAA